MSAYVIVCLSVGGGAGGGRADRKTDTVCGGDIAREEEGEGKDCWK